VFIVTGVNGCLLGVLAPDDTMGEQIRALQRCYGAITITTVQKESVCFGHL
jgi:hypothetical protein